MFSKKKKDKKGKQKKRLCDTRIWWYVKKSDLKKEQGIRNKSSSRELVANNHLTASTKSRQRQVTELPKIDGNMKHVDFSAIMPRLRIYGGSLLAAKKYLEDVAMIVSSMDKKRRYTIFTTLNRRTGDYYISSEHLKIYTNRRMRFYVELYCAKIDECTDSVLNYYSDYDQMSLLSMYGYRVGKSKGLPAAQRQEIISFLIDGYRCSVSEIVSLLQFNIRFRENSEKDYRTAINHWKEDLEFLLNKYSK